MPTYLGVWSLGLFSPIFFSTSSKKKKKKKKIDQEGAGMCRCSGPLRLRRAQKKIIDQEGIL